MLQTGSLSSQAKRKQLPININFTTQSSEVFEPANNYVSEMGAFVFMFVFNMLMRSKSYISARPQRILNKLNLINQINGLRSCNNWKSWFCVCSINCRCSKLNLIDKVYLRLSKAYLTQSFLPKIYFWRVSITKWLFFQNSVQKTWSGAKVTVSCCITPGSKIQYC
jgi:hypothetical protein